MTSIKIACLSLCLATAGSSAQNAPQRGERPDGPRRGAQRDGAERPDGQRRGARQDRGAQFRQALQGLDLTEDQRKQIHDIMAEQRKKAEAFREANQDKFKALRERMREAGEAKDREAAATIRKEMAELHKNAPKPDGLREAVLAILTEDQKKALKQKGAERGHDGPPILEGIELSDENKKKVHDIMQAHRQAVQQHMQGQREKMRAIHEAARDSKDPEARKAAMEKMKALREGAPKLAPKLASLLTAKQLEQFKKNVAAAEARRGERQNRSHGQGRPSRRSGGPGAPPEGARPRPARS